MKHFSLDSLNAVVLEWADDRTVLFTARQESEEDVQEIVQRFETLRERSIPIYTEKRLKFFFPDIREISKDEYTGMFAAITQYNVEAQAARKEADSQSYDQLQSFLMSFSTRNPTLLSPANLSTLVGAFKDVVEESILDQTNNDEEVDEHAEHLEALKTLYIILRHTEKTSDTELITSILRLVRGG